MKNPPSDHHANPAAPVRPNRAYPPIYPAQQDISKMSPRYYNTVERIENTRKAFAQRLFELRAAKGVSAREMSLSLGQGSGYISNLENRHNLPSMAQFFAICEYLGITPAAFFAFETPEENNVAELAVIAKTMDSDDLRLLLEVARKIRGEENSYGRH